MIKVGSIALFYFESVRLLLRKGVKASAVIEQMYYSGVHSLSTTVMAGVFVGAIMAIQINLQLRDFGAQSFLGGVSASTTLRDVGPVLIAFMLSGKVGAYTSAEIATMRVTDQVDAIRCLGVDPLEFLVLPRLVAVVFSSFLLLAIGLVMSLMGGMLISAVQLGVNVDAYLTNMTALVTPWSVALGLIKSFVFGNVIALVACYEGYHASSGSEGVGMSVKRAAVTTLVWILVFNYAISVVASALYDGFRLGDVV